MLPRCMLEVYVSFIGCSDDQVITESCPDGVKSLDEVDNRTVGMFQVGQGPMGTRHLG